MIMSPLADRIARLLHKVCTNESDWDEIRNEVDILTGSDFATSDLDRLTDMVRRRLPPP